ncbi:MAG: extracellular solute-binding protein [Lachnospiraceae bacterium]|nr:extracellular solute-binding protein [Lachnospiraceae bacterium]
MKKKTIAAALICMMTGIMLQGCGNTVEIADDAVIDHGLDEEEEETPEDELYADAPQVLRDLIEETNNEVVLTVWASAEDQDLTQSMINRFIATYPTVKFDITLGSEAESTAKETILADPEGSADVFTFVDDQLPELLQANALMEVDSFYTYDVKEKNVEASVKAACDGDKLYAYPMTADNGYFLFYDKSVFSASDVTSMEKLLEKADEKNKKVAMDLANGWYLYSFFRAEGLEVSRKEDGSNTCNWNKAGGTDVAQAILDLVATGNLVNMDDATQAAQLAEGKIGAIVNGTWRAADCQEAWGENYAATKLPTVKINGKDKQMASFCGSKLIGINPHTEYKEWAKVLAEFLTNEENQIQRFEARGLGPSNIVAQSSDAVKADVAIAALAEQAANAYPQRVGANYWSPAENLGAVLAGGNKKKKDLQKLLDETVDEIMAPIEKE